MNIAEIAKNYRDFEEVNDHSGALILLAENFGNEFEKYSAKKFMEENRKVGYSVNAEGSYLLHTELWKRAKEHGILPHYYRKN